MKTIISLMLFLLPMMCFAQQNVGEQKEQLTQL